MNRRLIVFSAILIIIILIGTVVAIINNSKQNPYEKIKKRYPSISKETFLKNREENEEVIEYIKQMDENYEEIKEIDYYMQTVIQGIANTLKILIEQEKNWTVDIEQTTEEYYLTIKKQGTLNADSIEKDTLYLIHLSNLYMSSFNGWGCSLEE